MSDSNMSALHTPGQWGLDTSASGRRMVSTSRRGICKLIHDDEQAEADARLISAAPDLLAVLQAYLAFDSRGTIEECAAITERARTAIAQSTGSAS